jgi:5'-3' exonuclease
MSILIVDATNLFIRNYAAVPTMDLHGNPNGGVFGTLISLKKIMGITKPSKIIMCWDGVGRI